MRFNLLYVCLYTFCLFNNYALHAEFKLLKKIDLEDQMRGNDFLYIETW